MIRSGYDQEKNIIRTVREGDITAEDLIGYIRNIDQHFNQFSRLRILDDMRHSNSLFNHSADYEIIIREIEERAEKFEIIKVAVVVDTPEDTALSMLYEKASDRIDNYFYDTFSTQEAAEYWLLDRLPEEEPG